MWLSNSIVGIPVDSHSLLRVEIVGAGFVAPYHLRSLKTLTNVKVIGVADLILERAKATAQRFQLPCAFTSIEALLEEDFDVLYVLTPPGSHFELAMKGLQASRHVFVEKPFTCSVEECNELVEAARFRRLRLCVDHSLLGDRTLRKGLELLRRGDVGDVLSVQVFRAGVAPGRTQIRPPYPLAGDPFREVGVHALYTVAAFLGSIRDASCVFRSTGNQTMFKNDEWSVQLKCEKRLAQVHLSWNGPAQMTVDVRGVAGRLRIDLSSGLALRRRVRKGPKAIQLAVNPIIESVTGVFQVALQAARYLAGKTKSYHGMDAMISEFYRALREGSPMPVSHAEALNIVMWTEQIAKIAETEVDLAFVAGR